MSDESLFGILPNERKVHKQASGSPHPPFRPLVSDQHCERLWTWMISGGEQSTNVISFSSYTIIISQRHKKFIYTHTHTKSSCHSPSALRNQMNKTWTIKMVAMLWPSWGPKHIPGCITSLQTAEQQACPGGRPRLTLTF